MLFLEIWGEVSISKGSRNIVIFKLFFSLINFTFVTRKWDNKSAPIELVTWGEIFYFLTST